MLPKWKIALIALLATSTIGTGLWYSLQHYGDDRAIAAQLTAIVTSYRRIILVMDGAGAGALDESTRARCRTAGRRIFWDKQQVLAQLTRSLEGHPDKLKQVVRYVSSPDSRLRDADRLAFLDLFEELAGDSAFPDTNNIRAPSRGGPEPQRGARQHRVRVSQTFVAMPMRRSISSGIRSCTRRRRGRPK